MFIIRFTLVFFTILFVMPSALAQFSGPGIGEAISIKEAKKAKEGTNVILQGKIVRKIRPEHFLFRDSTGELEIEIDDEDWSGTHATTDTELKIWGEVEYKTNQIEIEVKQVESIHKSSLKGGGFK